MLRAGATADSLRFRWLDRRDFLLEQHKFQRVPAYPSQTQFHFSDGRVGDVRYAADIPAGVAGDKGKLTAFDLDADIPALLCKGAAEALRGKWIFSRFVDFTQTRGD